MNNDDEYETLEHRTLFPYRIEIDSTVVDEAYNWCDEHMPDPEPRGTYHGWRWDYYEINYDTVIYAFRTKDDLMLFAVMWA